MFDIIFGAILFTVIGVGFALIMLFFVLWPMRVKQRHDYWCHRNNIPIGEDHGNQEPHV